eukprot:1161201-Pelagomonas_calceolata.AAC.14
MRQIDQAAGPGVSLCADGNSRGGYGGGTAALAAPAGVHASLGRGRRAARLLEAQGVVVVGAAAVAAAAAAPGSSDAQILGDVLLGSSWKDKLDAEPDVLDALCCEEASEGLSWRASTLGLWVGGFTAAPPTATDPLLLDFFLSRWEGIWPKGTRPTASSQEISGMGMMSVSEASREVCELASAAALPPAAMLNVAAAAGAAAAAGSGPAAVP